MTRLLRRYHSDAGGALVELAVALPVLVLVFAATIDFARVFYVSMALTDAARAGAQYGSLNSANSGDISGMQNTATAATNTTGITAVASRSCRCATDSGTFSDTSPVNDCTSTCAGTGSAHLVVTVTVTTTKTFTSIMTGIPTIPTAVTLTRTATMRVHQ